MEEALGPDNTHTVKALPPTSWHLTIVFCLLFFPFFLTPLEWPVPCEGLSDTGGDTCPAATRVRCAQTRVQTVPSGLALLVRQVPPLSRGPSAHLRQVRRYALPCHRPHSSISAPKALCWMPPPTRTPASMQSTVRENCHLTGQRMRRSVAWGPPCRSRRPWCPRHRTAPQALVHRKRPEGCELPRGRLPSLRFESICKFTSAFELSSAAVGQLTGFLTQLRAVRDAALTRFCLLPAPWG